MNLIVTLYTLIMSYIAVLLLALFLTSCAHTRPTITTPEPILSGGCLVRLDPLKATLSCTMQGGVEADIVVPLRKVTLQKVLKVLNK